MPETTVGSDAPPKVDIDVKNGGGGGADHIVGLFVTWNPVYLEGSNPSAGGKLEKAKGYCVWSSKVVPSGNTVAFSLDLKRKNPGITWVLACTMDPATGAFTMVSKWEVPEDHPPAVARAGRKKKKKKKKAAKKVR